MTGSFPSKPQRSTKPSSTSEKTSLGPRRLVKPSRKPTASSESKVLSTSPSRPKLSKPTPPKRLLRYLCFDLENRPSAYWFDGNPTSEITAICWKWSDEKEPQSLILRHGNYFENDAGELLPEKTALGFFRARLEEAGVVYGHNIRKHDLPLVQAALVRAQIQLLKPLLTTDTLRDLPKTGGLARSLDNLATMYGLPGKKFHMTQHTWEQANQLTDDGVALARKRVVSDVLLQEKLRDKLFKLGLLKAPRMWRP